MLTRLTTLGLLALVMAACTGPQDTYDNMNPTAPYALTTTTWQLQALDGQSIAAVHLEHRPTLLFDATMESVSGLAGVNRFTGSFAIVDSALKFGPLATTRMAGPPEAMAIEDRYLKALHQTTHFRLTGGHLQLLDGDKVVAEFKPAD